jgi:hypothetical protein
MELTTSIERARFAQGLAQAVDASTDSLMALIDKHFEPHPAEPILARIDETLESLNARLDELDEIAAGWWDRFHSDAQEVLS